MLPGHAHTPQLLCEELLVSPRRLHIDYLEPDIFEPLDDFVISLTMRITRREPVTHAVHRVLQPPLAPVSLRGSIKGMNEHAGKVEREGSHHLRTPTDYGSYAAFDSMRQPRCDTSNTASTHVIIFSVYPYKDVSAISDVLSQFLKSFAWGSRVVDNTIAI